MRTEPSLAQAFYPDSVKMVHILAKQSEKKKRLLVSVNALFIGIEYVLLTGLFLLLFKWRLDGPVTQEYLSLFALILVLYTILSLNQRLFHTRSPYGWVEEFTRLARVVFNTAMITIAILFLLKVSVIYSRALIILFFLLLFFLSWSVKGVKRIILRILTERERLARNVLIIGAGKVGRSLYQWIKETPHLGYRVVGFLDDAVTGEEIKGSLKDFRQVILQHEVDEVLVSIPSERQYIQSLIQSLRNTPISIKIVPELYDLVTSRIAFEQVQSYPFVEVNKRNMDEWQKAMKRGMDLILSLIGLILFSPVFLIIAIAIKIDSPGPVFFKQKRTGKNGKVFYMYKFRSMIPNAEQRLKEDPILYKKYIENNYKLDPEEDPRITKLGRFLRRTSLDELPQLFNVLKGDMSLVGPRPVVSEELKEYGEKIEDFLSVKPGVTGYWQVSGRSGVGYPERVDLELYYVYNQSILMDIKIILKTVATVLRRDGAY